MANEVVITIKGNDQFSKTADSATKSANVLGSALGKVSKIAGGFVLAQGLLKAPAVIGGFASAASNLAESMNKVNVVFGANATQVTTWSQNSAKAFGQSQQQALEAAGTFGNLFTAMGVGQDESAGLSTKLVELASDLSSFNNIPIDEALVKLRAGLVGEAEPLRTLGVQLTAATTEAKAMEMGLADANGEISESAKVSARYALILEQTTSAQGDFSRTSDGMANQQRILKANWANLQSQIGQGLLPVMTQLVKGMNDAGIVIQEKVIPALQAWYERHQPEIDKALADFKRVLQDDVIPIIKQLVAIFEEWWPRIEPIVTTVLIDVVGSITAKMRIALDVIKIILALIQGDWSGAWNGMKDLLSDVWDEIVRTVTTKLEIVRNIVATVLKGIKEGLDAIPGPNPAGNALQGAIDALTPQSPALGTGGGSTRQRPEGVGAFATGTPFVPRDMLAMVHRGERIIPAAENTGGNGPSITINVTAAHSVEDIVATVSRKLTDELRRAGFAGSYVTSGAFVPS